MKLEWIQWPLFILFRFIFSALLISSCAHRSVLPEAGFASTEVTNSIQMESFIRIFNRKSQSASAVRAQIAAEKPAHLRVDLVGPMSVPLAQLILKNDQLGVNLFRERKSYTGRPQAESVRKAIPIAIDPKDLMSFIFQETPKDWKCGVRADTPGRVCVDPTRQMRWLELTPKNGDHGFRLETAELQIDFDNKMLNRNSTLSPQLFEFRQPSGYKTQTLD